MAFVVGRAYSISNLSYCVGSNTPSYLSVNRCFYYQDETHMDVYNVRQIRVIREGEYDEKYYSGDHVLLCNEYGSVLYDIPCEQVNRQDNKYYISFYLEGGEGISEMYDWLESGGITEIYTGTQISMYFESGVRQKPRKYNFIYRDETYNQDTILLDGSVSYVTPFTLVAQEGYSLYHREIKVRFYPHTPVGWDDDESVIYISPVVVKGNQIEFGLIAFERYRSTHPEADESFQIECDAYNLEDKKYILFGSDTLSADILSRINGKEGEIYKQDVEYGEDYSVELSLIGENYFTTLSLQLIKDWLYDRFYNEDTGKLDCCESIEVIYINEQKVKIIFKKVFGNIDDESIAIYTDDSIWTFGKTTEELNIIHEKGLTIELYRMTCEKNFVDKTNYINKVLDLNGTLREACTLMNPVITIEYFGEPPTFNYVYIPKFNRYYFVTALTNIRDGLWSMSLHVDVLMTYKSTIKQQIGFIARNEDDYNPLIEDDQRLTESGDDYEVIDINANTSPLVAIKRGDEQQDLAFVIGVISGGTSNE